VQSRRPSGELEAAVLAALWSADGPQTPTQVQAALDADLAYTTVMTTLSRLWEKGVVDRERVGRAYAYQPVLDQNGIAAAQMHALLDQRPDRRAVLAQFVDGLSASDERALSKLLGRAAPRRSGSSRSTRG
jgi:predicted transcriptional regulator